MYFASVLLDYNLCLRVRKKSMKTKKNKGRKGWREGERKYNEEIKQEKVALENSSTYVEK